MRNENRISEILKIVNELWMQDKDLRFFQLIFNLQRKISYEKIDFGKITNIDGSVGYDFFNFEDDQLILKLLEIKESGYFPTIEHSYKYRFVKSTWGISIEVNGRIFENENSNKSEFIKIQNNLYYKCNDVKVLNYKNELEKGIKLAFTKIDEHKITYIILDRFIYSLTDFQKEGIIIAVRNWILTYFKKTIPEDNIVFSKFKNKYVFKKIV